jgi:uncharacterized protein (TIGR04255 family)
LRLDGYTLFCPQKIPQLHFETSPSSIPPKAEIINLPIWQITKSDEKSGFILGQSQLTYHTTHYETHDKFFNEFLFGLERVHSIVKLEHLSRLGLRYLNAVLPKSNETTDQYLIRELQGLDIPDLRYSLHESVFNTKLKSFSNPGTLVNRVICKFAPLSYPPDIAPHDLISKFNQESPCLHAIIDMDHFIQEQIPIDFKKTKSILEDLHEKIESTFQRNTTDYAKKVWK